MIKVGSAGKHYTSLARLVSPFMIHKTVTNLSLYVSILNLKRPAVEERRRASGFCVVFLAENSRIAIEIEKAKC